VIKGPALQKNERKRSDARFDMLQVAWINCIAGQGEQVDHQEARTEREPELLALYEMEKLL
jgi:hypothetical protein